MLVPLTQSLYAPGKLGDTGKVLIDIGTGYFVEVRAQGLCAQCASWRCSAHAPRSLQYTPADGVAYCRRKVLLLRENVDKLGEVRSFPFRPLCLCLTRAAQIITVKRRQLMQVQDVLQRKMASSQGARRA